MSECIFCKIIKGEIPCYKIWENDTHIAILDIFPISKGMTLVLPKKHIPSYIINISRNDLTEINTAMIEVAKLLDQKLKPLRTTFLFEGVDVNHLHAKLIPLYGDNHNKSIPTKAEEVELQNIHKILAN